MKSASNLLSFLQSTAVVETDCQVEQLYTDSRQVTQNSVFIALQGETAHGNDFIPKAIELGASLILTDTAYLQTAAIPVVEVSDLVTRLPELAKWFYNHPSSRLNVVGITGTNGKTSTAFYLAQLLQSQGQKVALMGTLGNGLLGELQPSANTTLEVVSLNRFLAKFVEQGVQWCVMEVSSHAVSLGRISGIVFYSLALTQVTRDHLDFHGSLEAYQQAKRDLFLNYEFQTAIINADDKVGESLIDALPAQKIRQFSLKNNQVWLSASQLEFDSNGFAGQLTLDNADYPLTANLMGGFNVENLLCALGVVLANGFEIDSTLKRVNSLKPVTGRMEMVHNKPSVIIDYAHTPDALQSVLLALKQHAKTRKIWLVFGCGGDRDQGKRALMGEVAQQYADEIMVTNDNPRFEAPKKIIDDILIGMTIAPQVLLDRRDAIEKVLEQAGEKDLVLIAGKGHENYQEIEGVKHAFSDFQVVLEWSKQK